MYESLCQCLEMYTNDYASSRSQPGRQTDEKYCQTVHGMPRPSYVHCTVWHKAPCDRPHLEEKVQGMNQIFNQTNEKRHFKQRNGHTQWHRDIEQHSLFEKPQKIRSTEWRRALRDETLACLPRSLHVNPQSVVNHSTAIRRVTNTCPSSSSKPYASLVTLHHTQRSAGVCGSTLEIYPEPNEGATSICACTQRDPGENG